MSAGPSPVESVVPAADGNHSLRRELGLRDLIPMQILLVVGLTWAGNAARVGGTHVWYWLAAIVTLFVPLAAVVGWCATVWPIEGGVYQWTKYALGPFAGFMGAWNFGLWALLTLSDIGILTATSISYGLGPSAAWMQDNHTLILGLTVGLFALMAAINLPGFGIGRWVAHFGTAVTMLVTVILLALLFYHPHATAAHPHIDPQAPFSFGMPVFSILGLNLFTKIAFNSLSGLEQVAVFAGETRNPGRTILLSAWIAAPVIAVIYMLMTGAMLAYTPAGKIDLTGPIPQVLAAAFNTAGASTTGIDWGLILGRGTILILGIALIAQFAVIVAETSRLPMVAGWDGMIPAWFTRLDPRWKTPTRSIAVIAVVGALLGIAATYGTGAQEAFQIIISSGNLLYGVYYLLLFAIPLAVGKRFHATAGAWLKIAAVSGLAVTLLSMGFNLLPIIEVQSKVLFAVKVTTAAVVFNLIGIGLYWNGTRSRTETSLDAKA